IKNERNYSSAESDVLAGTGVCAGYRARSGLGLCIRASELRGTATAYRRTAPRTEARAVAARGRLDCRTAGAGHRDSGRSTVRIQSDSCRQRSANRCRATEEPGQNPPDSDGGTKAEIRRVYPQDGRRAKTIRTVGNRLARFWRSST